MAVLRTDGFVIRSSAEGRQDQKDRKVIGVHIVGPEASDLISEAALAIEMDAFARGTWASPPTPPDPRRGRHGGRQAAIGEAVHVLNR